MASVPCPQCGNPVGIEETGCSQCRQAKWRRRRPKLAAVGVAAAVVTGLVWLERAPLKAWAQASWRDFTAEVERTRDPAHLFASIPAASPEPAGLLIAGGPRPAETAVSSFAYISAPPPAAVTPPADAPASAAPVPTPPIQGMRRWYGLVYDLSTLLPVDGAQLRFISKDGGIAMSATTDAAGHYWIDMSKNYANGMVSATISAPAGYRTGLLEDRDPPLREQSREARQMVLDETTDSDLEPVPLRVREGAEIAELNFVLLPSAKK